MKCTALLTDEDAVSPVIGVVLMVGITVALAAVTGTFVLGVDVSSSPPDATFRYESVQGANDAWGDSGDEFVIHHDGGEDVALDQVVVEYAGASVSSHNGIISYEPGGDLWRPGETWTLEDDGGGTFASDEQVLVLWRSADGSSSQILASGDLP